MLIVVTILVSPFPITLLNNVNLRLVVSILFAVSMFCCCCLPPLLLLLCVEWMKNNVLCRWNRTCIETDEIILSIFMITIRLYGVVGSKMCCSYFKWWFKNQKYYDLYTIQCFSFPLLLYSNYLFDVQSINRLMEKI